MHEFFAFGYLLNNFDKAQSPQKEEFSAGYLCLIASK